MCGTSEATDDRGILGSFVVSVSRSIAESMSKTPSHSGERERETKRAYYKIIKADFALKKSKCVL